MILFRRFTEQKLKMKPQIEHVPRLAGRSLSLLDRRLEKGIPFIWHHHPEVEITLTLNCQGQRFIGDNVEQFDDGDLVLVGSNLPHSWNATERHDNNNPFNAKVIWFNQSWLQKLSDTAPELQPIQNLCTRMHRGLRFSNDTAIKVREAYNKLFATPDEPDLLTFLQIMRILAEDKEAVPLASQHIVVARDKANDQLDRVLKFINDNYASQIRMSELAKIAALSPSALDRMFQRQTKQTISAYVINLRIGAACAQLATTAKPIAAIANEVGYNSLANFNRQFRKLRNSTPRAFRDQNKRR